MNPEQLKQLCKLFNISVKKRHIVLLQNRVASIAVVRELWKHLKPSDIFPRELILNYTITGRSIWELGYNTAEKCNEDAELLKDWLAEHKCLLPTPLVKPSEGYIIMYNDGPVGTKFDFGNTGKKGLAFPLAFYNYPCVMLHKDATITLLKDYIKYIIDQLLKKKEYSSIKDKNGKILTEVKSIMGIK